MVDVLSCLSEKKKSGKRSYGEEKVKYTQKKAQKTESCVCLLKGWQCQHFYEMTMNENLMS